MIEAKGMKAWLWGWEQREPGYEAGSEAEDPSMRLECENGYKAGLRAWVWDWGESLGMRLGWEPGYEAVGLGMRLWAWVWDCGPGYDSWLGWEPGYETVGLGMRLGWEPRFIWGWGPGYKTGLRAWVWGWGPGYGCDSLGTRLGHESLAGYEAGSMNTWVWGWGENLGMK